MILLDSNILMYAAGAAHPHKADSLALLERVARGEVEAAVDAFEILSMESMLMSRLDQRAKTILAQPKVEVKGFIEDKEKNAIYIFLRVTDRATGKVKSVNVREGDVFNDLRVVAIIGNNKAVQFEYLKIPGLIFEVKGPEY